MKKHIYESEFKTGPSASIKQQMLFSTDTKYAFSEGYEFIKTSDGITFQILDSENLIETNITEEMLQSAYSAMEKNTFSKPETVEFDPEAVEGSSTAELLNHNLFLIQSIINNTLSQEDDIKLSQVKTMIALTHLSNMLFEGAQNVKPN